MVVSCCNHVSHVRSSVSSRLTLSRVPLFWWVLVPHTVTPFLLYHATPFSLHKFPKHLLPLLGLLWLCVWCFLCTPAKTHSTTPSTQKESFKAMKTARDEMLAINEERRLSAALRERQSRSQHFILKEGDLVRVYRENPESFEVPFPVHSYDQRKTVWVEARDGTGRLRIVPFSLSQKRRFIE